MEITSGPKALIECFELEGTGLGQLPVTAWNLKPACKSPARLRLMLSVLTPQCPAAAKRSHASATWAFGLGASGLGNVEV